MFPLPKVGGGPGLEKKNSEKRKSATWLTIPGTLEKKNRGHRLRKSTDVYQNLECTYWGGIRKKEGGLGREEGKSRKPNQLNFVS